MLESGTIAVEVVRKTDRNAAGSVFMLAAVIGYSLIPLLVAGGNGANSPFLFSAGLRFGLGVGHIAFLAMFFGSTLRRGVVLSLISRRILTWSMFFVIINQFEYGLFAWATRFVDISIAAVLFESWPVFLILLTAMLFRGERRYRDVTVGMVLLLAVGFIGFAFVAASESGRFVDSDASQFRDTLTGIGIVLLAVVVACCAAFAFRWGTDLNQALPPEVTQGRNPKFIEICCVLIAGCTGNFIGAGLNAVVGFASGETIPSDALMVAMTGGCFAFAAANIAWRTANLLTDNLGINAFSYATPIFSLIWLFLFAQVDVARVDYLIIGSAAIISANLLVNFEAEVRFGFKAMVLALWGCGAFVYLRDEILYLLPFGGWLWPRETYLGALGLSATVFILLLTFRVARLAPRTQDEDNRTFALHRNLELLATRKLIAPEASQHIRGIDSARTPEELQSAYRQVKLCFVAASEVDHTSSDRRMLADAEAQLNMMVHSRQQGLEFGELFSLIIFGGITVVLALLSRPEVSGWTAFLLEVFSTLFPAVIIFLIFNVWDLHKDRADLVLASQVSSEGFGVIFRDAKSRRFEQSVSLVIGLLIIVSYAGLLWYKWVG